jgi:hypothetical protein
MLSKEVGRDGLVGGWAPDRISFRRWFKRSISSWPLSSVKARRASNCFLDRSTA